MNEANAILYGYPINNVCDFLGLSQVPCYRGKLDFVLTTYIVLCFLGMLLVAVFPGVGLINMPYDFMNEFIFRPKPILPEDFNKRKKILLPMVIKLRD